MAQVEWTRQRTITRRGVLWLGLKCDVRCKFCYDEKLASKAKAWIGLDEAKAALNKFRYFYGNEFVDFMGGEPTLHPQIVEVVEHAAKSGLRPTIITHGMHLARIDRLNNLATAGLHDVLMSVHAVGDTVREIHGRGRENSERQRAALENLRDAGIPTRFNVTMIKDNLQQLPEIAELAARYGVRVVNFLTFNPYFEWSEDPEIEFQAKHSEIAPWLKKAIDVCTAAEIEANVRYMPICQLRGYEHHVYTGYQLPYDVHEWDYNSWYDYGNRGHQSAEWYFEASCRQQERHNYEIVDACRDCRLRNICDGFHKQYLARWGADEADPYVGTMVADPTTFIREQLKLQYLIDEEHEPVRVEDYAAPLNVTAGGGATARAVERM